MFLFFNDIAEDFGFMVEGVRSGVITAERLDDAVRRVLGLKAKLGLPGKKAAGTLLRTPDELAVIGCEEHLRWQAEAADASITLVKNTLDQLPIRPTTHRRIRLYYLDTEGGGIDESSPQARDTFVAELESRGFRVTLNDGASSVKDATLAYRDEVDAAIVVANIVGYAAENNCPIRWKTPMSTDCPWYVHEVPTVMVSLIHTTHLHDATTRRRSRPTSTRTTTTPRPSASWSTRSWAGPRSTAPTTTSYGPRSGRRSSDRSRPRFPRRHTAFTTSHRLQAV